MVQTFLSLFVLKVFDNLNRSLKRVGRNLVRVNLKTAFILNKKLRSVFGLEDCDQKTVDV